MSHSSVSKTTHSCFTSFMLEASTSRRKETSLQNAPLSSRNTPYLKVAPVQNPLNKHLSLKNIISRRPLPIPSIVKKFSSARPGICETVARGEGLLNFLFEQRQDPGSLLAGWHIRDKKSGSTNLGQRFRLVGGGISSGYTLRGGLSKRGWFTPKSPRRVCTPRAYACAR